jgi:hypothetical protein
LECFSFNKIIRKDLRRPYLGRNPNNKSKPIRPRVLREVEESTQGRKKSQGMVPRQKQHGL